MKKSISTLQKQAKKSPQYILKVEGLNLYLADFQSMSGVNLTAIPKKAMKYAVGFDDADTKISVWNKAAELQYHNSDVKFEIEYL